MLDFGWVPTGWFRGRRKLKVAEARKPRRNRTGTFSTITLGTAAIAFLLALFGVGPFAVQAVVFDFGPASGGPLSAAQVFPSVSPVQKIVDVYQSPQPAPAPAPRPNSSPSPVQTEPPEPGDN
jgi:hypothetical protein